MAAMISGFCRDVFNELPDEFGAEVNQLMSLKLEGSVGQVMNEALNDVYVGERCYFCLWVEMKG